jgi:hypothetical protein
MDQLLQYAVRGLGASLKIRDTRAPSIQAWPQTAGPVQEFQYKAGSWTWTRWGRIFGIGLILFDAKEPQSPSFDIRVRAAKHEPDMFSVNR